MLDKGQKAPDFSFIHISGKEMKLSDMKGKKVILYFILKIIQVVAQKKHVILEIIMNTSLN